MHALSRWLLVVGAVAACKQHERPILVQGGSAAGSSEADFAAQLKTALGRDLTFDEAKHQLTGSNETISTTNLYQEWMRIPEAERPAALARIAASFRQTVDTKLDWASAKPRLRPAVRSINYFDPANFVDMGAEPRTIARVMLGDSAGIGIAIDSPDSMAIATDKELGEWKLTPDQALAIATANLRADGAHLVEIEHGVWGAQMHDSYDASRIVLVDDIRKLNLPGGAVALIPNRETLLLAGAKDAKGLLAMAARAETVASDPRPIHTVALCLGDAGWRECVPDITPEVRKKFGELAAQGRIGIYGDDHDAYQKRLGDDLFVAHLSGMQKPSGESVTYATWTKTVPTMLPKADVVAFVVLEGPQGHEKGKVLGLAPWDRVMAVCGDHLKETGRLPPYWATGDWFPGPPELAKLQLERAP